MRRCAKYAAAALALALPLIAATDRPQSLAFERREREAALAAAVTARAEPGDLVFISAGGTWSDLARFLSRREKLYSHVGVIARAREGLVVIHAGGNPLGTGAGVHADTIPVFMVAVTRAGIYRLPERWRRRFLAYVEDASARRLPFDNEFSLATADRLYCTELVWRGLIAAMGRDPIADKPTSMRAPYVALDDVTRLPFLTAIPLTAPTAVQMAGVRQEHTSRTR